MGSIATKPLNLAGHFQMYSSFEPQTNLVFLFALRIAAGAVKMRTNYKLQTRRTSTSYYEELRSLWRSDRNRLAIRDNAWQSKVRG